MTVSPLSRSKIKAERGRVRMNLWGNAKPIETSYRGYRFRSRLEARWAVYFDSIGIPFSYEIEGFDLDGVRYLPDFWLPRVKMWAEVKPGAFSKDELRRCRLLAEQTSRACLLLDGLPEFRSYWAFLPVCEHLQSYGDCDFVLSNYHGYPLTEGRFYGSPSDFDFSPESNVFDDIRPAVMASAHARFESFA